MGEMADVEGDSKMKGLMIGRRYGTYGMEPVAPDDTTVFRVLVDDEKAGLKYDRAGGGQLWSKGLESILEFEDARLGIGVPYPVGAHNVHKVNATGFQDCVAPLEAVLLVTNNDVITLATLGKKWYICGVGKHCEVEGQKLVITVLPKVAFPTSSPQALAPTSSTKGIASLGAHMLTAVALVIMAFIT
ncbi:hypothetical protein GIB67_039524 [Kingdonia uniflora]|uniref:Phytocyanin domain-containing protein n=1 Tax=Kingdonia uniflora TaxID=39325 RepID=A0A7J7LJ61_9MAGN|nr:hypothetical protein GIB67_039524 [Kingdonia uniflora]